METITSRQNPLMTHIRKLAGSAAYRRQTGECLCDSPKLLREAAQWGADVRTVVSVLPWDGPLPDHVRQVLVPPEVMSSVRASMGAVFRRPVWSVTPEELGALLRHSGIPLYGAALRPDALDARQADYSRCALAIGSEGRGLSREVLDLCDKTVLIPMSPRCESLNAAIAAAVLLWESWR